MMGVGGTVEVLVCVVPEGEKATWHHVRVYRGCVLKSRFGV